MRCISALYNGHHAGTSTVPTIALCGKNYWFLGVIAALVLEQQAKEELESELDHNAALRTTRRALEVRAASRSCSAFERQA